MTESTNFGDIENKYSAYDSSKVVVLPVPYDDTSTWLKGADIGPAAILEASANMELYDIETDSEVYKQGIFTSEPVTEHTSPEKMIQAVQQQTAQHIAKRKFIVTIGGEHSVSLGSIKTHAEAFEDLTVLQLDAHADLRDEYDDSKFNHACVMARAKEIAPIVQVGIRSMCAEELPQLDTNRALFAKDIIGRTGWVEHVITKLSEHVYITIDLDVLDPSIMPSTGTPEPGGLLWYDVLALLRAVCNNRNVVGFDVVELCPNKNNKAPDFLAAKLIYKILSYKFSK
ncbi:MAG: agmatinase [Phycisphaerales bacterium]|jgi:agmatinase